MPVMRLTSPTGPESPDCCSCCVEAAYSRHLPALASAAGPVVADALPPPRRACSWHMGNRSACLPASKLGVNLDFIVSASGPR